MSAETIVSGGFLATINEAPIKTNGAEGVDPQLLQQQAEAATASLVPVDITKNRSTCLDERGRTSLRNGQPTEPRPSVLGGSNIEALAIAELTGYFPESDTSDANQRLGAVTDVINAAGLLSGGHEKCAANGSFWVWLKTIAETPEKVLPYAESEMGEKYQEDMAQTVVGFARAVIASGRYATWSEANLPEVLGEEESGEAIEVLLDVPHEGLTVVRNKIEGYTINQSKLYEESVLGKGSFVFDDWYAEKIEHALTAGPDATYKKQLAEHARELAIAAVAGAVPNEELYQITLSS
jgi:hypothetical protein